MGLNLSLFRFAEDGTPDSDSTFDSGRYTGDREFDSLMSSDDYCEYRRDKWGDLRDIYWRPNKRGFNFAREWIPGNILEGNQERLFNLLDRLESDENLWMQSIY